jgi:hypothetical protein
MGDVTQVLQETIEGHKVVKLFGGQRYEADRFRTQVNSVRRFMMKQTTAAAASVPVVQMLAGIALACYRLSRNSAIQRQPDHSRRICLVRYCHADADGAPQTGDRCERAAAAGTRGGGKRLRAH